MDNTKVVLAAKTIEISETSTYLTLRNRLCYYGEPNLNNVCLPVDGALEKAETLVNMPVVAKYKIDAKGNPDLGGHEMAINPITKEVKFGTENIGVHTAVEIAEDFVKVNGIDKKLPCLFADIRIWKRNKNIVAAIERLFSEGKLTNSWEIISSAYTVADGIKTLQDYCFEAVALLGSAVTPAYDGCASTLSVASADEDPQTILAEALALDVASRSEEEEDMKNDITNIEEPVVDTVAQVTEPEEPVAEQVPAEPVDVSEEHTEPVEEVSVDVSDSEVEVVEEAEQASLTSWDLRKRIESAARNKINKWVWINWWLPAENTVWCEYEGAETELDYAVFTYEVDGDSVTVSEPIYTKLKVSVQDINQVIEEKDNTIASANDEIQKLKDQIEELSAYKEEKDKAELESRQKELSAYALRSKLISEDEIANDATISEMIQNVDKSGINAIIAERFMKQSEETEPAVENEPVQTASARLDHDEVTVGYQQFMSAFFKKNK